LESKVPEVFRFLLSVSHEVVGFRFECASQCGGQIRGSHEWGVRDGIEVEARYAAVATHCAKGDMYPHVAGWMQYAMGERDEALLKADEVS